MSTTVYIAELVGEPDPLYLFSDPDDRERFAAAAQEAGREVVKSDEPLIDREATTGLIVSIRHT